MALRYGIVGAGSISGVHFLSIPNQGEGEVCAVCDIIPERAEEKAAEHGGKAYTDYREMIDTEHPDVVVVLTPHYPHPEISAYGLMAGCHVLCEKPLSVTKDQAQVIIEADASSDHVFSANYMQRYRPEVLRVKEIIDSGALGQLQSALAISNGWLRGTAYYEQGGWRGTWELEGGGVLSNQAPHDLDRLIFLFGSPRLVQSLAGTSPLHHSILVEDYVDALLLYESGLRVTFSTATHIHPGVDRLEIWGDKGYLKMEGGTLKWGALPEALPEWDAQNEEMFGSPEVEWREETIETLTFEEQHGLSYHNLVAAIRGEEPVNTPAAEGVKSVELGNAMILAGYRRTAVELPLNSGTYESFLREMVELEKQRLGSGN